jgi:Fe2+ or Zn2+ uptake regulation protein
MKSVFKFTQNVRQTPVRQALCDYFKSYDEPADYIQIMEFLDSSGRRVNKTTVYRQLDFLVESEIIQELDFGEGKKRYELAKSHHHHLLCTSCDKIECIAFAEDLHSQEAEILKTTHFKVTGHMLEFFGICKKCQNKENKLCLR